MGQSNNINGARISEMIQALEQELNNQLSRRNGHFTFILEGKVHNSVVQDTFEVKIQQKNKTKA